MPINPAQGAQAGPSKLTSELIQVTSSNNQDDQIQKSGKSFPRKATVLKSSPGEGAASGPNALQQANQVDTPDASVEPEQVQGRDSDSGSIDNRIRQQGGAQAFQQVQEVASSTADEATSGGNLDALI